jgi:hypothetical protein
MEAELATFEADLFQQLDFQMKVNLNRTEWETTDLPNETEFDALNGIVEQAFHALCTKYRSAEMFDILYDTQIHLENALWVGLNVPWPRDVERHTDQCIRNVRVVFTQLAYNDLLAEMTLLDTSAQKIQTKWRRAISNPEYTACRNRLRREFTSF